MISRLQRWPPRNERLGAPGVRAAAMYFTVFESTRKGLSPPYEQEAISTDNVGSEMSFQTRTVQGNSVQQEALNTRGVLETLPNPWIARVSHRPGAVCSFI